MRYTVVEANESFEFSRQVNAKMGEGCDLKGGVSITTNSAGTKYAQALKCPAPASAVGSMARSVRPRSGDYSGSLYGGKRYTKSSNKRSGKMTRRH